MVLSKEELGKLVKEARNLKANKLRKKYTQSMLAKDIGKSQSYIGDIESGRTYPAFKVLSQIAQVCDVPFSFFENKDYFKIEENNPKSYEENLKTENNLDVKDAMDSILSQHGLMLNGEILSDDSKIALSNAIKLGLQYAEQMQKK
ncbi:helix-turn-helix domain-containing protein [Clostridium tarantellae]|uniref:Helix-turn-helix domain-containing protein n=1 Tax=Clostridium tarantellae TaxID=39493 RepID=A0A6I1MP83_9CLOT|nr:helix-turn-helix transcriptional regulator [Clostridium tarantellae]MPQ44593.1 helix-turn-helix domain-containing protein [Clostridium tarantellae]